MRTTVRIKTDLLQRAKKGAAMEGRTLTSFIEEGLALLLAKPKVGRRERVEVPAYRASGGLQPGVDLNRSSELEEILTSS